MTWWPRKSRHEREEEMDRELCSWLEAAADDHTENGLSVEEARFAARRTFGNTTRVKEEVREMWSWNRFGIFIQDIGHAMRALRKSPGFALTTFLTLALGIGASTAIFTVVDSVILRPLAYRDSGSLVTVWEHLSLAGGTSDSHFDGTGPNPHHVDVWRQQSTAFSGLALASHWAAGLALGSDHPRLTGVIRGSANFFDVLGATPLLGRTFIPEDDVPGNDNVAILSYSLWQSLFHGDSNIIGKSVRLAGHTRQVIGVLRPDFRFPNGNSLREFRSEQPLSSAPEPAIYIPAALDMSRISWGGEYGNWLTLARLKPGIRIRQAEAQLNTIEPRVLRMIPTAELGGQRINLRASVQPMQDAVVGASVVRLWLLMGAVLGLMSIACMNLANAQLGRAISRQREAAVRAALGASRWRLLGTCLIENVLLAGAGGVAGIALAAGGLNLLRLHSPVDLPRLAEVHLNFTVLLFSLVLSLGSSILFGLAPAIRMMRTDPQTFLQNSGRISGSRMSGGLRAWLICFQVFGCTVLLLLTALFSKSLLQLLHRDKGFETRNVALAEVRLSPAYAPARAGGTKDSTAFADHVLQNLRELPGVQTAGLISAMPLEGETWIDGVTRADKSDVKSLVNDRWVSPGYFETLRERLVAGRFFEERDRKLKSIVLSESLAKAFWGAENPIGGQILARGDKYTVIGVVADSRNASLKADPPLVMYFHYVDQQQYLFAITFAVRSDSQPMNSLLTGMRQAIWKYAPDTTISRVKTLDSQVSDSLAAERFQTLVFVSFGVSALLLAMLGIYGVLSYSTAARRQEIGVRIALGATRRSIYTLTSGGAAVPVFVGIVGGLAANVLAGRTVRGLIYGVETIDPSIMALVIGLFLVAAIAAAFVPARRAASVDPMEALRSE